MFIKTQFITLFDYHWHTNRHLMNCAAKLSEADYFDKPGEDHGSIHDLLFHILQADSGWRKGLETGLQQFPLSQSDHPDLDSLKSGFEREQLSWQALLDSFTEQRIKSSITLKRRNGKEGEFFGWCILQHIVLHGMQYQSEIAQLLT